MAGFPPLKRREVIRRLRAPGFAGPFRGTRHEFLVHGKMRQTVPANAEFLVAQLRMLLRQVETVIGRKVTSDEWENL